MKGKEKSDFTGKLIEAYLKTCKVDCILIVAFTGKEKEWKNILNCNNKYHDISNSFFLLVMKRDDSQSTK